VNEVLDPELRKSAGSVDPEEVMKGLYLGVSPFGMCSKTSRFAPVASMMSSSFA